MMWVYADAIALAFDEKRNGNPTDVDVLVNEFWQAMQAENAEEAGTPED